MPTGRLTMRRIRDVLRLKFAQGLSERSIAASLGLGKGSVGTYLRRARDAGLRWPLPDGLDDDSLELLLFPSSPSVPDPDRPVPDWAAMDKELRKRSVTRMLLWEEYRAQHPGGFGYTWFCTHFDAWKGRVRPSMRQTHAGGEKVFVDYAGDTIDIVDPETGEVHAAKLFVATMGASSYTYVEAVASEGLEDWIGAHTRMFAYLGGVPKAVVPDNLKSAVIKPDRYDPGLNRTYAEMAEHYSTAILPARVRKPKDKAKVEVAVQVAQRWILARLRNHRFFSLAELNAAIRPLLDDLNTRVMRDYGASRADLFATLDRPSLQPLPADPYVFARWKRARVAPDYHVEVDRCWYSVPFSLIRQEVDVRATHSTVEVFHRGKRIASHVRNPGRRSHVTVPDHMPSSHRRHAEWTPARVLASAEKLGPSVAAFCQIVMEDRPHPEQGFRTCMGVLSLAKSYEPDRLDAACRRGVAIKARSVSSIRSILKNGLDQAFLEPDADELPLQHPNIRGQKYYH
ncbi:IS21 family transposase [Meridianimarinicoccus aquatilis]|uniref:IS21 family transposase n=1 Tax=Meridianimarinicoccus aquatilis TaxID=2552766 RepID=A0A4R6AIN1_9RHOB|nr:IS21 family transposase [Fluviibacterium aquatile]QIE43875.1 IS21 family transposase [Rhodobacteraceae bacterium SC52]TDL83758.1 IS21 family transposase [Fluviibacterium aquatile]TDL83810.1 IS21 family transposase [Fluviibacterium aquatile]TDL84617.1 IS21 family transposase [Fluviibacterium aquatile]TDL85168.1 IS21 family transposase [Fluviibacterium aquatile]